MSESYIQIIKVKAKHKTPEYVALFVKLNVQSVYVIG